MSNDRNPVKAEAAHVLRGFPMIGSTSLLVQHQRRDGMIAATNGKIVWLGPEYFAFKSSDRLGVLLHEYLHVALAHPARGGIVRNREGAKYSPEGFNIAADALINETIRTHSRRKNSITLPGGIVFAKIIEQISTLSGKEVVEGMTASNTSVERLYRLLMEAKQTADEILTKGNDGNSAGGQGEGNEKSEKATKNAQKQAAQQLSDLFSEEADLKAMEGSFEELNEVISEQAQRVANAKATYGSTSANIFESLTGDLPVSRTSWKKHFRSACAKHLGRERKKNASRPSGSMMSQRAMNRVVAWESGRKRSPQPKVLVVGDSSGSILMDDFKKFLGETDAMRKRTGALIDYAVADTEIRQVIQIKDMSDIRKIEFKGRGGTSFIQPLKYAEENKYDMVIYLTDMDGGFPERCRIPVIWAVTNENDAEKHHPFGRMLCVA